MIIHNLDTENSVLKQFIAEIRDVNIQDDRMRFRRNIERIGEVLGYELSKTLNYDSKNIATPLDIKTTSISNDQLIICSILRAGLPLHQGLLNYFDRSDSAFISAYRHHPNNDNEFEVVVKYLATPSLKNKILVMADPMLATGKTLENTFNALAPYGVPSQIHIVSVIGSKPGVAHVENIFPENTHLWIAAVDETLNDKGYIVPGLGDAGDLAYGHKL